MRLMGWNRYTAGAMALAVSGAMAPHAAAQSYPVKPIRMVCPSSPGGTTDYVARLVAQNLTEAWGQQVVVDDRPGAGGIVGTEMVAKALPDGYTLLLGTITTHAINPALHAGLAFDAVKDFAPISLVVSSPQLLAVHPSVPVRTVKELIALAKAKPGQFNYGSAGSGNSSHLVFELFKSMTGIAVTHVPYKGSGPAISALVGGEVQMIITGIVALYPQIKSGRLRGIAVTSLQRAAALPDLPTISESGVPGFDVTSWFGVFAPARTSNAIVMKLNAQIRAMLDAPQVRQRLISQGADPASNTPEQFAAFVESEQARWSKVVKDARIQPE